MPSTALIYCRVSSDRQASEGHGLDGQERRCREYAAAHGYDVMAVFRDEGASGGTFDRPALGEMFDYMRRHRDVEIVLFEDVSRIARDMGVHVQILSQIARLGAKYQTVNQPIEDTAVGKFIVQSLANVAELHRNLNAQNVKSRMRARLQAGYWVFQGPPGYVFRTVPGHGRMLVPDGSTADTVREALEGFASGRLQTHADVRLFLEARGLRHPRGGDMVYAEQVRRLLEQILYTGHLRCEKWSIPLTKAQHEPLISLATFDRIQERLARKSVLPHDRRDMAKDFPLRGFVLCAGCRKPFTASWSKGRTTKVAYYHCIRKGCPHYGKSVRKDLLEKRFEELLRTVQPRPEVLEMVRAALLDLWNERIQDFRGLIESQQKKVDTLDREIRRYCAKALEATSPILLRSYEEKIEEMNDRKLRLGSRIEADTAHLASYDFGTALGTVFECLKEPCRMWESGRIESQRAVLRLVFQEPLVYDREKGFGTATLSLPLAIAAACGADGKRMVELASKTWNQIYEFVNEQAMILEGRASAA